MVPGSLRFSLVSSLPTGGLAIESTGSFSSLSTGVFLLNDRRLA
jgi:hypothetical protein